MAAVLQQVMEDSPSRKAASLQPSVAVLLQPTATTPKKVEQKKLTYAQAISQMISCLLEMESNMMQSEIKDQENQSKIQAISSSMNHEVLEKQRKEVKKNAEAQKHQHHSSFFGSLFHAIVGAVSIVIGGLVGGPVGLAIAATLFALSETGAMNRMFDSMHINNSFAKFAVKMGVIAGLSMVGAGAGYALSSSTEEAGAAAVDDAAQGALEQEVEQNGNAAADQAQEQSTTRMAKAKSYGKLTAASALPAVNPTQELFTGLFVFIAKATGGSEQKAKEAAQIIATITNAIISIGLTYRMFNSNEFESSKFKFLTKNPNLTSKLSALTTTTAVIGGLGEGASGIATGFYEMKRANILKEMAATNYENQILQGISELSGEMVQHLSQNINKLADMFAEENSGFKVYQAAMNAAAQHSAV